MKARQPATTTDNDWVWVRVITLFAIIVGVLVVVAGLIIPTPTEAPAPTEAPTPAQFAYSDSELEAIQEIAAGYARLGRQYGVDIDDRALAVMVRLEGIRIDVPVVAHWVFSEQDIAEAWEQSILDDGEYPKEYLQRTADRIERWKDRTRFGYTGDRRPRGT